MSPVLIHVQHLMGIGHQRRAAAVARALCAEGAEVIYVSGGMPVPGLDVGAARFVQLPPARAEDLTYRALVDEAGRRVDDAWRAARRDMLLAAFARGAPGTVVLETYPFGRRLLRFELEPLLAAARARRPRPTVACSLRDILERRGDPARYREMADAVCADFDLVLVHGDPRVVGLESSFPETARIADRVRYTGYVAEAPSRGAESGPPRGEVVVSSGGGVVGARLLETALAAARAGRSRWRLLVGPNLPAAVRERLAAGAGARVVVEGNRSDFPALLAACRVSVSQAGYNTVTDLLAARARAVLVPFVDAGNTEQGTRAALLARHGLARVVLPAALTPQALAEAVRLAAAGPRPPSGAVDLDGARRAARLLVESGSR